MTKTRLTEIDLLRFAAAVAVVIFHLAFRGAAADGLSTFSYPAIAEAAKYGYLVRPEQLPHVAASGA